MLEMAARAWSGAAECLKSAARACPGAAECSKCAARACPRAAAGSKWPLEPAAEPQLARNGRSSLALNRKCSKSAARACSGATACARKVLYFVRLLSASAFALGLAGALDRTEPNENEPNQTSLKPSLLADAPLGRTTHACGIQHRDEHTPCIECTGTH